MTPGEEPPVNVSPDWKSGGVVSVCRRKILPVLGVLLIFLTFVTFPTAPQSDGGPACDADASLSLMLDDAHARSLQFGTQHAYTYGPLGFTTFFLYSPQFAWAHMIVDVLLGLVIALGVWMLGLRLKLAWRCVLIGTFVWSAANFYPRVDFLVNTGILCFGLLCMAEDGRMLLASSVFLVLLSAFAALAKNSFLFMATFSIALTGAALVLRGRWKYGVGVVGFYMLCFGLGWCLCGQNLGNLESFWVNALAIVRGYNGALGWEAQPFTTWIGGVGLGLGAIAILTGILGNSQFRSGFGIWRGLAALVWLGALIFGAWKHGFVRAHPSHMSMFFGFAAMIPIAAQTLICDRGKQGRWGHALALGAVAFSLGALQWLFFPPPIQSVIAPILNARRNLQILTGPAWYQKSQEIVMAEHGQKSQLPFISQIVGTHSVDVFGQQQAYALYNNLNYSPRPVPQSYAACSADLMELNQRFYLSHDAPRYVMFELEAIDRKFPVLDDARTLRHLLINYRPVTNEGPFLLLRQVGKQPAKLMPLARFDSTLGASIDLRKFQGTPLWLVIKMSPSISGRIRQFMIRPPAVRLAALDEPGGRVLLRRRAPASMLSAGFVATPLFTRTGDVMEFYSGKPGIHPGAYSVEVLPEQEHFWDRQIIVEIYGIENLGYIE